MIPVNLVSGAPTKKDCVPVVVVTGGGGRGGMFYYWRVVCVFVPVLERGSLEALVVEKRRIWNAVLLRIKVWVTNCLPSYRLFLWMKRLFLCGVALLVCGFATRDTNSATTPNRGDDVSAMIVTSIAFLFGVKPWEGKRWSQQLTQLKMTSHSTSFCEGVRERQMTKLGFCFFIAKYLVVCALTVRRTAEAVRHYFST